VLSDHILDANVLRFLFSCICFSIEHSTLRCTSGCCVAASQQF